MCPLLRALQRALLRALAFHSVTSNGNHCKIFQPDPEIGVDKPPWGSPCPGLIKPNSAISSAKRQFSLSLTNWILELRRKWKIGQRWTMWTLMCPITLFFYFFVGQSVSIFVASCQKKYLHTFGDTFLYILNKTEYQLF